MDDAKKVNTVLLNEIKELTEELLSEIGEFALMSMVEHISENLETKSKERTLVVDNRILLIPDNEIHHYHSQFPLKASFLYLTWFELMNLYKDDIESEAFHRFHSVVEVAERQGALTIGLYDHPFEYARDVIFEAGDLVMLDVIAELRDTLIENGVSCGDIDINKNNFKIAW